MKQFNSLGNRVMALVLSVIMLLGMLPTSVFAINPSALTTDIGEKEFVVGQTTEFTFTTVANSDAGKYVLGTFEFSDPSAVEKLEYLESQTGIWYQFYGDFGPVGTGFPMINATSQFRVTFNKTGDYTVKASMVTAEDRNVLCSVTESISVSRANPSVLTTNIGEVPFVAGKAAEFTFTTTANADAGTYVLGTFVFSDPSAVEKLEYRESQTGTWYEFYGDFGPAGTGFPMTNATSQFRVTFNKVGTYTVTASMVTADNRTVLCSTTQEVTVAKDVSTLTTNIGNKTFVIGKPTEFTFTTTANADAGTYVLGTFEFSDPSAVEKLEYLEVQSGQWFEFYGDFGPAGTGFPMTNATSQFRVTFNKVGTYSMTASMVTADNGTVLCSVEKTVAVADTSKLTTNIEHQNFVTGQTTEFTFTTTANGDAGTYVLGSFVFSDPSAIEKLEYLEVQSGQWFEFYGDFGPAGTGFPMTNATSRFRVTFKKAGSYTLSASMQAITDGTVLCKVDSSVVVAASEQTGFAFESANPVDQWIGNTYKNIAVGGQTNETIIYEIVEGPATIAADGTVTFTGLGAVTVKAIRPGNDFYKAVSATYVVTSVKNAWEPFGFAVSNPTITYAPNLTYPNATLKNDLVGLDSTVTFAIVNGGSLVLSTDVATIDPATGVLTILKSGVVIVRATRAADTLYTEATAEYTLTVVKADQTIAFETVTEVDGLTYQTGTMELPGITGRLSEKDIVYTIGVGDGEVAKIENGKLQLLKSGYFEMTVVVPTDDRYNASNTLTWKVTVQRADQTGFDFAEDSDTITYNDVDKNGTAGMANEYTMITSGGQAVPGAVSYEVVEGDAAIFDRDGVLTIKKAGTVKIKATKAGDDKYNAAVSYFELTVEKDEQSFTFNHDRQIAEKYGLTSFATQITPSLLNSDIVTYVVSGDNIGATVDNAGLVSFANSTSKIGTITITVTMVESDCYKPFTDAYTITLSYENIPDNPYSLHGDKIINSSDWFTGDITILAADGYQISYSNDLGDANVWKNSVVYTVEGISTAEIYLKHIETGGITDVIQIENIKLDTTIPQTPVITYGVPVAQKLLEELTFGFYKAPMQVVVTAEDLYNGTKDAASGIETITLTFEGQKGKYITEEVSITEIQNGEELTYTMDKEFYGIVSAYAVDIAGHKSSPCTVGVSGENGIQTVVVDSVAPEVNVAFQTADTDTTVKQVANDPTQGKPSREDVAPADANTRYVYSGAIQAVITVKEANFYEDNITVTVLRGGVAYTAFTATGWVAAEEAAVFQKTITLAEDGDYQLLVEYADNSGNNMELTSGEYGQAAVKTYTSNIHTVDANGGTFQVEYKTDDAANGNHYSTERTAVITVTDRNFRPDGVVFQVTSSELASDETVSDTALNTWDAWTAVDGEEHTWQASYDLPGDHRYEITMSAKDIAGNVLLCDNAETYTNSLVVDGSSPENLTVEYSKHTLDQILENLTFGYHEADKIVTLTATDTVSGIKSFQVLVTPDGSEQATNIAIPENLVITVDNSNAAVLSGEPGFVENVSAETENGTTSVSFKVPAEFRGTINFTADNMAAVSSEKADNRQVLIVDNMAPRRGMTFTPNRVVDAVALKDMAQEYIVTEGDEIIMYYTDDAVATIRVQEENCYPDEVQISVTRDGAVYTGFTASEWTQVAEDGVLDTYEKTITIPQTDEGDYFITMTYTDKSGNVMETYTSQRIVIDNTAPTIEYAYSNNDVISTSDDGSRNYFNAVQTVKVTINDRNFRADDVVIKVNAKDVTGGDVLALNENGVVASFAEQGVARDQWTPYVEGTWRAEGDSYEIVLVFDADANYDLSVEYTDLATNSFASETKSFTVDKTAPKITNVEYSKPNIVDEVLKAITFDNYYGDKVTVTVTIKEDTSGIDEIIYSYLKRAGSSNVNAGESDIMITEGIERKDNMFTVKFQVPRVDLTNTTQFDGTVTVTANDRSNNTDQHEGDQRLVVDNISPRSTVTYNAPVTTANGISYYAGDIEVAVEINEANFDSGDVKVTARKDGEDYPVKVNWTNNSVDRHTGTFILTEDGDYTISVTYTDKSGNQMQSYTSDQLTLDTTLPVISVSNVKANSANKDEVYGFVITVKDINLDASSLAPSLTAVVKGEDGTYTTQTIALGEAQVVTEGQEYTYTVENLTEDALYTLTCSAKDMSANTTSSILLDDGKSYETVQFSINRQGSAFGYGSDYTDSIVSQYYVYSVDEDVVLVEVNADPIENYTVKLNGTELTEGTDYTTEQTSNNGEWSKRTYKLSKALFAQEGAYNIIVSSVDKAETTAYSDVKNVRTAFVVDQTAPVITITGLEDGGRYQTDEQTVTLIPSDEGGRLNSLKVVALDSDGNPLVNEETGEDISVRFDMSGEELLEYLDANDGKVTITIPGGLNNQVQIVCDDCAANSEGKPNTYEKTVERVTVSQSGLVIFYANKPAFYGTIGGTAGAAGLLIFLLTKKKKAKV